METALSKNLSKNFFLVSFLPAIAYWYMETRFPLRIALAAGVALGIVEIVLERVFTGAVHTLSRSNLNLILFLGAIALLGNQGVWFKLQPFFTGMALSGFLVYRLLRGRGMLVEMMESLPTSRPKPPRHIVNALEKHLAVFFFAYGVFMGALALWASTARWVFFKTAGFYAAFVVFMVMEMIVMRVMARQRTYALEEPPPPQPSRPKISGRSRD